MRVKFLLIAFWACWYPLVAESQNGSWLPPGATPTYPRTLLRPEDLAATQRTLTTGAARSLYQGLYADIQAGPPTDNASPDGRRARATFAKNTAFVALLDRQPDAATGVAPLPEAARASYLTRAQEVVATLNPAVEPFYSLGGGSYTEWQWRSKELIDYLIAYDLLRGAGVSETALAPAKTRLQQFAGNLYRESHRPFLGFTFYQQVKNNHTLMTAAALGMAAVVLHDATSSDAASQPANWLNAALFHIDNVLWQDAQRQSEPAAVAGYAEGPYYFKYAFLNCLPFFRALGHFVPDTTFSCTYASVTRRIPHPFYDARYAQLYDWITAIMLPDGRFPALEDSYVDMGMPELALTGQRRYVLPLYLRNLAPGQLNTLTAQLRDATVDMRAAYLAARPEPTARVRPVLTHLPHSGNLILQAGPTDSLATYLHLYGKSGLAHTNSGGHSQADATSFILHARGQLLALDAGYLSYNRRAEVGQATNHNMVLVDGTGPAIGTAGAANDAPATLPRAFQAAGLAFGEAQTTYQNATITRKVLFVRQQYYLLADVVQAGAARRYTWQLHGYGLAGGTAQTGTFSGQLAAHEGIWEKNGARLLAHVATPGATETTYATATNVHELRYNTPESHTTLLVHQNGRAQTQFLTALYPTSTTEPAPAIRTTSTATAAGLLLSPEGFRDVAFVQSDTVLVTNNSLPQPVSADAALTFLAVDASGNPAQAFLDEGTLLRYGSRPVLQSARRATVSWQPQSGAAGAGYVSRATTLTLALAAAPAAVTGPGVRGFTYDADQQQLTIGFTQASEFQVLGASRPLPVQLTQFGARRQGPAVQLTWQTATELHNRGFAIQRSTDGGQSFQTVGFVSGQGSSLTPTRYQYLDATAPPAATYYRLQQHDHDGRVQYSAVQPVAASPAPAALTVAPVPAHDVLTISFPGPTPPLVLRAFDRTGRLVHQQPLHEPTQLSVRAWPAGLYYLRCYTSTGQPLGQPSKVLVEH